MAQDALGRGDKHARAQAARAEAPEFKPVTWWKDPGLRKLYFWCAILMTMSASTGFDACVFPSRMAGWKLREADTLSLVRTESS